MNVWFLVNFFVEKCKLAWSGPLMVIFCRCQFVWIINFICWGIFHLMIEASQDIAKLEQLYHCMCDCHMIIIVITFLLEATVKLPSACVLPVSIS